MKSIKNTLLTIIIGSVISSCSFVKLTPQAENTVVVNEQNSITNCKFLGKTNVSIWSSAETFQSTEKVVTQLDTLARNDAVKMGGNTVYPDTPVEGSTRTYAVYDCPTK